jgi:hypothetical protein
MANPRVFFDIAIGGKPAGECLSLGEAAACRLKRNSLPASRLAPLPLSRPPARPAQP